MKNVTIRMVAAAAGVSTASVSRVLNNGANVAPQLRSRVVKAARELGYSSSECADGKTIVIILPAPDTPMIHYGPMILNALMRELFERAYRIELVPEQDSRVLNDRAFCGAISIDFRHEVYKTWGAVKNIPLVCINDCGRHIDNVYSVCSNEFQGMSLALACLCKAGHRRIGLFLPGGQRNNWSSQQRLHGFLSAMESMGLADSAFYCYGSPDSEKDILKQLLRSGITAMICPGEQQGARIADTLSSIGLKIPEQLSLIAWEGENVSAHLSPPQTTLRQNFCGLAAASLDILEQIMHGDPCSGDCLVDYSLIERRSVMSI